MPLAPSSASSSPARAASGETAARAGDVAAGLPPPRRPAEGRDAGAEPASVPAALVEEAPEPPRRRPRPPLRRRLPEPPEPPEPEAPLPEVASEPCDDRGAGGGGGGAGRVSPMRGRPSAGGSAERVVPRPASGEPGRDGASAAWRPIGPVVAGATGRSGPFGPGFRSSGDRPEIGSDIGKIPSRRHAEARQGHPAGRVLRAPQRAQRRTARGAAFSNEHFVLVVAFGSGAAGGQPAVGESDEDGGDDERGNGQHEEPGPSQGCHPGQKCTCRSHSPRVRPSAGPGGGLSSRRRRRGSGPAGRGG